MASNPATLLKVIELGAAMRTAQRLYFRTRSPANLDAARAKEREFDTAAAAALIRQAELRS